MRKNRFGLLFVLVVVALLAAQCAPAATPAPQETGKTYKLAAIFPGVITDADYNTLAYVGISELQKATGVQTAYSESVAVPDVDRVMREYIDGGYNIIWTHGGQFLTQTVELAKQFPDVIFIGEGDAPVADAPANLWMIDRNFHVGFYGIGALAAKATQTGKIGYLGGLALPFSYAEVHAVQQAIKDLGLDVEVKAVWAGDFNDPTKARQVADALIAEGCDVIMGSLNLGMFGLFEAVKASPTKVLVTAKYTDKSTYAPDNYMTSLLYDFAGPLKEIYAKIQAGETGGYYPLGFATGVALQTPLKNISPEIQAEMDTLLADLRAGKIEVVKDTSEIK
uniref:BMP family ABC transporter substrate-binding protein n=1 Tax=Bellilinea caldifistulae TaxID=360411 RepID=A0A7C4Q2E5_9CHLR